MVPVQSEWICGQLLQEMWTQLLFSYQQGCLLVFRNRLNASDITCSWQIRAGYCLSFFFYVLIFPAFFWELKLGRLVYNSLRASFPPFWIYLNVCVYLFQSSETLPSSSSAQRQQLLGLQLLLLAPKNSRMNCKPIIFENILFSMYSATYSFPVQASAFTVVIHVNYGSVQIPAESLSEDKSK